MPTYMRPGTYVEEVLTPSQAVGRTGNGAATALFVGANPRGSVTPVWVPNWTEFTNLFGSFGTTELAYAMFLFFSNGGRGAYVQRIAGASNAAATRTLLDRAGSPVSTLKVDAVNPGAWGNSIYIDIVDGSTGRFDLVVKYGGSASSNVVERWTDLSMVTTDARYAPRIVNYSSAAGSGSYYVFLTDQNSATAAPDDSPAVQAGSVLSGGLDGSAVVAADFTGAQANADVVEGPLVVAVPGVVDTTVINSYIAYVAARADAFLVVDTAANLTAAQATTYATSLTSSSYAAVYYPQIVISDPGLAGSAGVTRTCPPSGAVVGLMQRTDSDYGVYRAPAGIIARVVGAIGLERKLTNTELDSLNVGVAPVNAIRNLVGSGVCIMGARTLKQTSADRYVPTRRSLIYLKRRIEDLTQFAIFEPNDQVLWSALQTIVASFLNGFWQEGGLAGSSPTQAFFVKCDATTNPPNVVQAGEVRVEVGVALQFPAEFVVIRIGQTSAGTTVTED